MTRCRVCRRCRKRGPRAQRPKDYDVDDARVYYYYCCRTRCGGARRLLAVAYRPHDDPIESRVFVFVFGPRQQQQQQPMPPQPPSDEEGEDRRRCRRGRTAATATAAVAPSLTPNGGGRSSGDSNPEQSARTRTHRTDHLHVVYAGDDEDDVEFGRFRRARLLQPSLSTANVRVDNAAASTGGTSAIEYRARRYGMYAAAASATTADARYGLRYGLSSALAPQDTKTSSAAAAFFLRLVTFILYVNIFLSECILWSTSSML